MKIKYVKSIEQVSNLSKEEIEKLKTITDKFSFRTNDYYLGLINWNDPQDPIKKIVIPHVSEKDVWGKLDSSGESAYQIIPGLEHKYRDTALLLCNDVCGSYCRFCFRKRLFMDDNDEVVKDVSAGIDYIKNHSEIQNVLLTGGDPLVLSTKKLEEIINELSKIKHVQVIRIGTKMPAFNPFRILNDPDLLTMFDKYNSANLRIFIMAHFNHPRELTEQAIQALGLLQKSRVGIVNQTPLIKGVNDSVEVLVDLFSKLTRLGIPPYYVFQCRPTTGNKTYSIPIERGHDIFDEARSKVSGLAGRARFVMSHESGKIVIIGKTKYDIYFKYLRAADPKNWGRILKFPQNPSAYWFDDYLEETEHEYNKNEFSRKYMDLKNLNYI